MYLIFRSILLQNSQCGSKKPFFFEERSDKSNTWTRFEPVNSHFLPVSGSVRHAEQQPCVSFCTWSWVELQFCQNGSFAEGTVIWFWCFWQLASSYGCSTCCPSCYFACMEAALMSEVEMCIYCLTLLYWIQSSTCQGLVILLIYRGLCLFLLR